MITTLSWLIIFGNFRVLGRVDKLVVDAVVKLCIVVDLVLSVLVSATGSEL